MNATCLAAVLLYMLLASATALVPATLPTNSNGTSSSNGDHRVSISSSSVSSPFSSPFHNGKSTIGGVFGFISSIDHPPSLSLPSPSSIACLLRILRNRVFVNESLQLSSYLNTHIYIYTCIYAHFICTSEGHHLTSVKLWSPGSM